MKKINVNVFNKLLSNFEFNAKEFELVESKTPNDFYNERYDNSDRALFIYKINNYKYDDGSDIYIKVEKETDSYGCNEHIVSISFVEPKEIICTNFTLL